MRGLKDRTVLVTGGANGIGAATARRLAEEGGQRLVGHPADPHDAGGDPEREGIDEDAKDEHHGKLQVTVLKCSGFPKVPDPISCA